MALQFASPRSPAAYLSNLKPILDGATVTRTEWLRFLNQLADEGDVAPRSDEIVQTAIRSRERFNEAHRSLTQMMAPEMYRDMERALGGWMEALAASCEPLATAKPPIDVGQVNAARRLLREAAQQADRFNAERASIITVGGQAGEAEDATEQIGNNKRLIILTLLGLVLMVVALYFAFGALGTSAVPSPTPTLPAGTPGPGIERRVYKKSEVLDRLKQEIAARKVAWLEPDVRLVPPDRIIVSGKIQGPTGSVPVEAEIQIGATEAGKPRVTPVKLNATGVQVPTSAVDALNKRADEANKTLVDQVAPNQFIRRLFVENDTVVAEIDTAGGASAGGTPAPAGAGAPAPAPAKPGA